MKYREFTQDKDCEIKDATNSSDKICTCPNCKNEQSTFLRVIYLPESGYFCDQCATDLTWHGIAVEESKEEVM